MLKFFVVLLLIAEGMTEDDICDKPRQCDPSDIPDEFPETEEEWLEACKPGIVYARCRLHYADTCGEIVPERIPMAYRMMATFEEICNEDTELHVDFVNSLTCFREMFYNNDEIKQCPMLVHSQERLHELVEALSEEGLVSLTDNENDTFILHNCINMMNFFACQALLLERECGNVAKNVYVDIVQKIDPGEVVKCENFNDLLPAVIRLYKLEEEKQRSIVEDSRETINHI